MQDRHYKGRGATGSPDGRFSNQTVIIEQQDEGDAAPETVLRAMRAGRIISTNTSPDVPFDRSINPYQGCEHGCVYCYARPSHSYLDLSPGLDFETRIFYKPNAASRLQEEWQKSSYECRPITIGANTDPYQPAEKDLLKFKQTLPPMKITATFLLHSYFYPIPSPLLKFKQTLPPMKITMPSPDPFSYWIPRLQPRVPLLVLSYGIAKVVCACTAGRLPRNMFRKSRHRTRSTASLE